MILGKLYIDFFTKQNVRRQLINVFICVVMIPILLVGGIIYFFSYTQLLKSYQYIVESDAIRIRSILLTTTLPLYDIYDSLAKDEALNSLLTTDFQTDEQALAACSKYSRFQQILSSNASLSSIRLYTQPDMLRSQSDQQFFYPIDDEVRSQEWYKHAVTYSGNFWRSTLRSNQIGNTFWELAYYCHIPLPQSSSYAILVMTISNNHLRSLIKDGGSHVYISVNDDPVFYSTVRRFEGSYFPFAIDYSAPYYMQTGKIRVENTTSIACITSLKPYKTDDMFYILAADMNTMPYIWRTSFAFLLILLFAIILPGLIFILFTRYFSARIQTLRMAMHKVSNDDYEIVDSVTGDDELSATFSDLKTMVNKIKETEAKIYVAQIKEQNFSNQQQQMELKLLVNQINPHFLYNTLETIRMKAFADGNQEVATAIKLLGKSMRYVLNNTKTSSTTLDKEIDYIVIYLSIQGLRFQSKLSYKLDIDETICPSHYHILPLLIQPIVENCIAHGLEMTGENEHIIIKIRKDSSNRLIIRIFDNGTGMSKIRLNEVIEGLRKPSYDLEHGVGLYNINNRIMLFYGESYGLFIKSKENLGTLVTLIIPLVNILEEKGSDIKV